MITPLLWLIYLFTCTDTERALLGSRRRFGVNGLDFWSKHGFQRRRSNFDEKIVLF